MNKVTQLNHVTPYLGQLSELLVACVDSDSSIGFLPPLTLAQANNYWLSIEDDLNRNDKQLLVVFQESKIVATVQLALATKANALHRAEVEKLMVVKSARGQGLAKKLMLRLEQQAINQQRSLLILDTRAGDDAAHLYRKLGFIEAGTIPRFALNANGDLDATVLFYKSLTTYS
jgi:ribosomal protein S18 acetylase RimI-like enzyme